MCIAGGYTTIMLYDKKFDDFPDSDIDVYIFGENSEETLHNFLSYVSFNYPNTVYSCKKSVINIKINKIGRIIQLIYTTFINPVYLLNTYDASYCKSNPGLITWARFIRAGKCCYYLGNTYITIDAFETFKSHICYTYSDSYDEDRIYKILKFGLKIYDSNILDDKHILKSDQHKKYNEMYVPMENNISTIVKLIKPFDGNDSLHYYDFQKSNDIFFASKNAEPNNKEILLNIQTLDLNSIIVVEKDYVICDFRHHHKITQYSYKIKYAVPLYSDSREVTLIYNIIGYKNNYNSIKSDDIIKISLIKKKLFDLLNLINGNNFDQNIFRCMNLNRNGLTADYQDHMAIYGNLHYISIYNFNDHPDIIENVKYKFIICVLLKRNFDHVQSGKLMTIAHYIMHKIRID
jgi:hypothetical protein